MFICTVNEDEAILERTIVGAASMDYGRFRVWVLDDGRRPWLEELSRRLGVSYLTRPDNAHAKAGNINNGLKHVAALAEPPDFISILDADFVPTSQFLRRALSLFRESDVGIVQTPQHFINPDPLQSNLSIAGVWPDEQRYFFDVVLASKDAWGAAFCCGTSSVIRFAELQRLGGFPTDSVTEDYLVTLKMKQGGYRTVYLNERLSLGLAPEGLKEYITQRSRWALGFMQIFRGPLGPLRRGNGLSVIDRVSLIEAFLYWFGSYAFRMLGIIVPILYLLLDVNAVQADVVTTLSYYVPHFVASSIATGWMAQSRVMPIMTDVTQLLAGSQILQAVAHGLTKPKGQKFKVTAKGGDRSQRLVQWPLLNMFLIYLGLTIVGVVWAFLIEDGTKLRDSSALCLFWSWYNMIVLTIACMVCIEQPRYRSTERLAAGGEATSTCGRDSIAPSRAGSFARRRAAAGLAPCRGREQDHGGVRGTAVAREGRAVRRARFRGSLRGRGRSAHGPHQARLFGTLFGGDRTHRAGQGCRGNHRTRDAVTPGGARRCSVQRRATLATQLRKANQHFPHYRFCHAPPGTRFSRPRSHLCRSADARRQT